MPGALTANAVEIQVFNEGVNDSMKAMATVALLSPVDGANNVLLTATLVIGEGDEEDIVTAQWYRCSPGFDAANTALGDAVGDPVVIDTGDTVLHTGPIVVCAIDRDAGLTSAYALAMMAEEENVTLVDGSYIDAVLYD